MCRGPLTLFANVSRSTLVALTSTAARLGWPKSSENTRLHCPREHRPAELLAQVEIGIEAHGQIAHEDLAQADGV